MQGAFEPLQLNMKIARSHEVQFYPDDPRLLLDVTQFIGAALKAGHGAIVVATESHRNSLLRRLENLLFDETSASVREGTA
jgi:hypothetical protein